MEQIFSDLILFEIYFYKKLKLIVCSKKYVFLTQTIIQRKPNFSKLRQRKMYYYYKYRKHWLSQNFLFQFLKIF